MINIYKNIEELSSELKLYYGKNMFSYYKIVLDSNNVTTTYLKNITDPTLVDSIKSKYPNVNFEILDNLDDSYDFMFDDGCGVDTHTSILHLGNLLNNTTNIKRQDIPVVTFYSYKGGVGRSTSLASFASSLAIKDGKRVVVLDCDFEAPGFTNFFLEAPDNIYYKNGLVEYFIDSSIEPNLNLSSYYWEASKKFSGSGSIWVFPAGNLSTEPINSNSNDSHLTHYLNGLSRLDVFHQDILAEKFVSLFEKIQKEIAPDVILIDSRTGFNDIFGMSAFRLSDIVVGFFGVDAQSRPGLSYFLSTINRENGPRIILANSIIPSFAKSKLFGEFKMFVNDITSNLQTEEDEEIKGLLEVKPFPIGYNDVLKNIGLPTSNYEDYIDLIKNNDFSDYNNLFTYIKESINDLHRFSSTTGDGVQDEEIFEDGDQECKIQNRTLSLKRELLNNVINYIPKLYAEVLSPDDYDNEYKNNRYFYRKCMEDLFNPDKFLVLGNKGTGKTYIYRSLANSFIVNELKRRARKDSVDYEFVQIINQQHRFDTTLLDNQIGDFPKNLFFERFWMVYIWNVLMKEKGVDIMSPSLEPIDFQMEKTSIAKGFVNYIKDDNIIVKIERDLLQLDNKLRDSFKDKKIIFIFDELDSIVKPHLWTERISPLINCCRNLQYACISPKLFLRSDLYQRTSNINNKSELDNRIIKIEWSKDEIFAYFFKFILSHSKDEFFELMRIYDFYPRQFINKLSNKFEKQDNQPTIDEYDLKIMCATFFGKYADVNQTSKYGESYDWFYNNLKNADETISLRPFIDLLEYAVRSASNDETEKPILPSLFYTNSSVRVNAVKKHFEDLAGEEGNTDLKIIFDYIRNKADSKYKRVLISLDLFSEMAQIIINQGNLKDIKDVDSMIDLLMVNGIISERFIRNSSLVIKHFQYALLYKYYLGLVSKPRK